MTALVYPEFGGRVGSLAVRGHEMFVTGDATKDPLSWGCYPMVPYAGRVRDALLNFGDRQFTLRKNVPPHSIHGTVFDRTWKILETNSTSVLLEISLGDDWPFRGTVQHRIQLSDSNLKMQLSVNARDVMPVQIGWHPWFVKPQSTSLQFGAMLQRDKSGIATEVQIRPPTTPVDDCFINPDELLTITIGNAQLTLLSDCSHWVIYDIPTEATCIEPQSGPPNGINDDPLILHASGTLTRIFTIEVQECT